MSLWYTTKGGAVKSQNPCHFGDPAELFVEKVVKVKGQTHVILVARKQ